MAEAATTRKRRFRPILWVAILVGLSCAIWALIRYLRSPQFHELVRRRVVTAIEDSTGGRVELDSFQWRLSGMRIEATDLTIHGKEAPEESPFVYVGRLEARIHIVSLLGTRVDLSSLTLDRPRVHFIQYPDGSNNLPQPKISSGTQTGPLQQLFNLAIGRAEIHNGILQIDEQQIPLEFAANDLQAVQTYSRLDRRYDTQVSIGKIDLRYQDMRPMPAQAILDFSLWENRAQIKRLQLRSQDSKLEAGGEVEDFSHPKIQFTYAASIDLPQAAAIARVRGLNHGRADVSGKGSFDAGQYSSSGKALVRDLEYVGDGLQLRKVSAATEFSIGNDLIQLRKLSASLLGGEVSGDAEIKNFAGTATASQGPASAVVKKNGSAAAAERSATARNGAGARLVEEGVAHLKTHNISVGEVARAISTRSLRLDRLNLAATASGTIDLAWKGSFSRATTELALDFAAPSEPASGELAVSGILRGNYDLRTGSLTLEPLNLVTPNTRFAASGRMGLQSAALDVTLATTKLGELQDLLAATAGSALPIELSGEASFNGKFSGTTRRPAIAGHLQATDVAYVYQSTQTTTPAPQKVIASKSVAQVSAAGSTLTQPAPPPTTQPVRVHFDSISSDLQYSPDELVLHRTMAKLGDVTINLDGWVSLSEGSLPEDPRFQLQAGLRGADIEQLQQIVGASYPIKGTIDLSLHAAGTKSNPQGRGTVAISAAEAYGTPIESASSNIVLANQQAELTNLRVKLRAGVVSGSAAYNLTNKTYSADLAGADLDLAKIPDLQRPTLSTAGRASLTAKVSGNLDHPVIDAHLNVQGLVLNEEKVGGLTIDAVTHGDELRVTGRSNFPRASFALDGAVKLQGDVPADLSLTFSNLDIDPLLSVEVKGRITAHSGVAGSARLSGPLRKPRELTGELNLDSFAVEIEKIPIRNDGPMQLTLANDIVTVKQLALASTDSHFTVSGTADLKNGRPLNLQLDGRVDLVLAQTFDPDLTASGVAEVNAAVKGTASGPLITGKIIITKGSFANIDLPAALGDLNGTLVFNQNRLEVEELTGRIGGGPVNFAGYITYGDAIGFDLTSQGTDIRFRYAGLSVTADQSLKLQGGLKNATASGIITITRFAQIPSTDLAAAFAGTTVTVPNATSPLNNLHLDVRILSAPDLTLQTSLAKLSGDADLRLRGTALRPVLLGRVNIAEGDIKLNGAKYHLERADITFANPVRIDPILDVEATTRVRDFDITIGLHGTLERLITTYRSDPPLSSEDIIALLAFGRTETGSMSASGSNSGMGQAASGAVLGAAINQTVSNRVSRLFGVSSIRINPGAGGPDNNPNARLTVEQQVSSDVTITYITNLARSAQQVIQFEYNISRDYTIEAIRDENGVLSFDLLVQKRKK